MATTNLCTNSLLEKKIKEEDIADNLLLPNRYLVKNTLIGIEKLNSRQLYSLLVDPSL